MALGILGGRLGQSKKPAFGALDTSKTVQENAANAAPVQLDGNVTLTNADGTGFKGGKLNVSLAGATSADTLGIQEAGGITVQGTAVYYNGGRIGTISSSGQAGAPLTVQFDAGPVSDEAATALARAVTYSTSSDAPSARMRVVTFQASDAENTVGTAKLKLSVSAQNDAPVVSNLATHVSRDLADAAVPRVVDGDVSVANPDGTSFKGGSLTIHLDGATSGDDITLSGGAYRISGNKLYSGNTVVGTVTSDGQDGRDLTIQFKPNANITDANITALMRQVSYASSDPAPPNAERTLSFTVKDKEGDLTTKQVGLSIIHPNHAPVAVADSRSTSEDTPLVFAAAQLVANDTDVDGDALTVTAVGGASHGTVTLANGQVTFTPDADYNGPASFTYTVSDGKGGTATGTVDVTVTPVNDAPVITSGGAASVAENGTGVVYTVAASDVDGDALTYALAGADADLFTIDAAGNVSFKAAPDFEAPADADGDNVYDLLVEASDGQATSQKAVAITVTDVAENSAPVIVDAAVPVDLDANVGSVGNGWSDGSQFSPDGTKVLFQSYASNLVAGDTNGTEDVFVKDLATGAVTMLNSSSTGEPGNGWSNGYQFSPDGTKVLFQSNASNLVAGDTNAAADWFVKDLATGEVTLVNSSATELQGNYRFYNFQFSPDGTKVLFELGPDFPVPPGVNVTYDIFVKDLATGEVTLVNSSAAGEPDNGNSFSSRFSPDGTKVLFFSDASNLVNGDTNGAPDWFVKDLATGEVTLVNSSAAGLQGNNNNIANVQFSPDGTKVLFTSDASNLVAGDANGSVDVFVKDLASGEVTLINSSATGQPGNGGSYYHQFSPDGTKVLFESYASNLVEGDTNGADDIFVKDLASGEVTLVSSSAAGEPGNGVSYSLQFSPDGTKVLFNSLADNLVDGDTNGSPDYFVKDLETGEVTLVNSSATGLQGDSYNVYNVQFSPDGTKVLFQSYASNLVAGDTNGTWDWFVKDLATGVMTMVNSSAAGVQGNNSTSGNVQFSSDGTKVLFQSSASNLVEGDANGAYDYFVKDLVTGDVTMVNSSATGLQGNHPSVYNVQFSPDGTKVLFTSAASNLVAGDTNGTYDIFVKDLATGEVTLVSGPSDYPLTRSGAFTFDDADAADTHTVSVVPAAGTIGTLSAVIVPVANGPDRVEWVYQADRDAFAHLPAGASQQETFTLTIDDGHGGTVTQEVVVNVMLPSIAPAAADDFLSVAEDTALVIPAADLLANDTDADSPVLTVSAVGGAVNGNVTLDDEGNIVFVPDADHYGPASFVYTVSDGTGATDTATVHIDVTPVNDAPVAVDDVRYIGSVGSFSASGLLANDVDVDGDALSVTEVGDAQGGTVSRAGDVITFNLASGSTQGSFTYTVTDGHGGFDIGQVTVIHDGGMALPA